MHTRAAKNSQSSPLALHVSLSPLGDQDTVSLDEVVVRVNGILTFVGALLMACVLVVILVPFSFSNTVSLATVDAAGLTSSDIDRKLDWYNARAGNITSLVEGLFGIAVRAILPVALLCVFTNQALVGRRLLGASSTLVLVSSFAVSYLLKNAFSSVNVRQESAPVISRLVPSDLREDLSNITRANNYTRWSATTNNPSGNPSTKTLLRSAILPSVHASNVTCSGDKRITGSDHVDYYFVQRPWMSDMLSVAPFTELSDVITMQLVNASSSSKALMAAPPMGFGAAQALLALGMVDLQVLFAHEINQYASPRTPSVDNFHRDVATATWKALQIDAFDKFARSDVSLQFSRTPLGDGFCFDAVTFTLPTGPRFFDDIPRSQRPNELMSGVLTPVNSSQCAWDGCLMTTGLDRVITSMPPQVHGFALCAASSDHGNVPYSVNVSKTLTDSAYNCTVSNTSMLVVSVAKRMEADGIYDVGDDFGVHNPRNTYKVSVGILSWNLSNLSATFGGRCLDEWSRPNPNGCMGVYFELDNANHGARRFALLGERELGMPTRLSNAMNYDIDARVVNAPIVVARTSGAFTNGPTLDDYLFVENANHTAQFLNRSINDIKNENVRFHCSKTADRSIERVRRNHFYGEEPLQQAYTAAMFWLFQNATVRSALIQQSDSKAPMPQLDFDGSVRRISFKASVPLVSAIMTLAGMLILFLLATTVLLMGRARAPAIQTKFTPALVTEAMLATGQFPRGVMDVMVTWNKEHVNLSEYKVKSLVLEAKDGREVVVKHLGHIETVGNELHSEREKSEVY